MLGVCWVGVQEGESDVFYREHRQRGLGFVHYLEELKRLEAGSNATEGGDEQGSLATVRTTTWSSRDPTMGGCRSI